MIDQEDQVLRLIVGGIGRDWKDRGHIGVVTDQTAKRTAEAEEDTTLEMTEKDLWT